MLIYGTEITAKPGKGGELAAQVTLLRDAAAAATGLPWSAWAVIAGRPYGSFMLSTRLDGVAALVAGQQAAAASPDFQALGGAFGDLVSGPVVTSTADVVATTGEPASQPQFLTLTQGQLTIGRVADGMAWSRGVIEHVKSVTGVDMMLLMPTAGTMSRIGFVAGADTADELDDVNAALAADTTFREMMDGAAGLITGSWDRVIAMRMP